MTLNIGFANCRGFSRKKPLIENLCTSKSLHILGVAETWASSRHSLRLPGFSSFRRDRACAPGQQPRGGVALFLHPKLPASQITPPLQFRQLEVILGSVRSPLGPILIALAYFPPTVSIANHADFFEYVTSFPNFIFLGTFCVIIKTT